MGIACFQIQINPLTFHTVCVATCALFFPRLKQKKKHLTWGRLEWQINLKPWCSCSSGLKLEHRVHTQASKGLNLCSLTSAGSCGESSFEGNPVTAAEPLRCAERWRLNTNPRGWTRPTYVLRELLWRSARVIWLNSFVCFPEMWLKWNVDGISLEESGGETRCFMRVKVCVEETGQSLTWGGGRDRKLGEGRIKARMKQVV